MAWSDTYPEMIAALSAKLGVIAPGIPKLTNVDAIALLSPYVASLRVAIEARVDAIMPSPIVDGDGLFAPKDFDTLALYGSRAITVAGYISHCTPVSGSAWKRYASDQPDVPSWEPCRVPQGVDFPLGIKIERNAQPEQIVLVREAMDQYQTTLNMMSVATSFYPYDDLVWTQDMVATLLKSLRMLGSDLDNMSANPPTTLEQDVSGALDHARHESEAAAAAFAKGAGKAAAEIGNVAGDVAGSFASGFLGKASIVTLGALVAFVAYKRFL